MESLSPDWTSTSICKNCGAPVTDRYCPRCGQSQKIGRLTVRSVVTETIHELTNVDRGLLHTLVELTLRPGRVGRAYVLGQRREYTRPLTFYLLMLALYYLTSEWLDINPLDFGSGFLEGFEKGFEEGSQGELKNTKLSAVLLKYGKVIMTLLVFTTALSWRLFYRKSRLNLVELLSFSLYAYGYNLIVATLALAIAAGVRKPTLSSHLANGSYLFLVGYLIWATPPFFGQRGILAFGKAFLSLVFALLLYSALLLVLLIIWFILFRQRNS